MSYHSEKRAQDRAISVIDLLKMIAYEAGDTLIEEWRAQDCKRDLVMIRYELDRLIKNCPNFGEVERDWDKEILMKMIRDGR